VDEGDVNFGAGTAWVLLANTAALAAPVSKEAYVCTHAVDGLYGQMLSMVNGGSAVQWVMQLFDGQAASQDIDAMLDSVPPGAEGLRCWPLLCGGVEHKGPGRRGGSFAGITLGHSRHHLVRAVVEGLACELLRHIRMLTAAGHPVSRLTMCGSAAGGRNTPQIIADIANLPVCRVEVSDVSALGAAMIARKLVDAETPLADIARQWSPARGTVQPSNPAAYRELLQDYFAFFDG
jgi:xylulokinase